MVDQIDQYEMQHWSARGLVLSVPHGSSCGEQGAHCGDFRASFFFEEGSMGFHMMLRFLLFHLHSVHFRQAKLLECTTL